ncbi:MAG: family 78 glycoside hydrolase catalytic domain [Ilumatobacter fluminis]|uniref:family 78 glycoside hydrolase catalytic domain n=1 Tax=Ilumatobacter fluminis TaxID=467091 RepID=UPI0032EEC3E0
MTAHRVVGLQPHHDGGLIGVAGDAVRLSWNIVGPDDEQAAARIEVAHDEQFEHVIASAVVPGPDQVAVEAPGGRLTSRERRWFRVAALVAGDWTDWSAPCSVEAGLLSPADWHAEAIAPGHDADHPTAAPLLRGEFEIERADIVRARLYATAHGVYELRLNGSPVADDLFAPGWTSYHRRLLVQTYDVTDLVADGPNCLGATLGNGWFRGRLGWSGTDDDRNRYGDRLALLAQLEIEFADGSTTTIGTGPDWTWSTAEVLADDFYDGCEIDLRRSLERWDTAGHDQTGWSPVGSTAFDLERLEPWSVRPIRVIERRALETVRHDDSTVRVDVGQNISGWVAVEVCGVAGDVVVVEHAEVVEPDGALHRKALRTAQARDRYVLAESGTVRLEPRFTFHGFRHAEVRTTADVVSIEAVAISSDLPTRSSFSCSNGELNQLASNVMWSLRDNFVGVPTDCPQRDERMGWTGDAQAFASTASLLVDARNFWASWLRDVALEQHDGGIPSVVPDVALEGESSAGRAGWADVATIAPWAHFEAYGDPTILAEQLPSMIRWIETLRSKRHPTGDLAGLLGGEFQFGDWLDPDAPSDRPWLAKVEGDYLANAFFAHSARLTARAAHELGHRDVALAYEHLGDEIAGLAWERWADHAQTSQTGCAVTVVFEIAPPDELAAVARRLADLVADADGAVSTGFLGTPLVLPALARHGYFDEAYTMLLRTESPSWLYQVRQGATTTWERWDAIKPDGSIHDGAILPHEPDDDTTDHHMLSFNHYAYGAVLDWMYRHLAGLAPSTPGYRTIRFAPRPCAGIDNARATVHTPYGPTSIDWSVSDGFAATVEVPIGSTATFVAPTTAESAVVVDGQPIDDDGRIDLGPGTHTIAVTDPLIVRPTTHPTESA